MDVLLCRLSTLIDIGFGFVTMDTDEAVEKVVGAQYHQINGKTVVCDLIIKFKKIFAEFCLILGGSEKSCSTPR